MKLSEKERIKIDILMLAVLPLVAVTLSLWLKLPFLFSTILFYGVPFLYFSLRTKNLILRTFIFSFIFSVPGGIAGDYLATRDGSWHIPTIFPFRMFGLVSVEGIVWLFLTIYTIVITYEHFMDKGKHKVVNIHMKNLGCTPRGVLGRHVRRFSLVYLIGDGPRTR